jgi:hypothetical protein
MLPNARDPQGIFVGSDERLTELMRRIRLGMGRE